MRTNSEWKYWGRRDPLWSVASWPGKEAGTSTAWTVEEFIALGAADFTDVLHHWKHYGLIPGRCVEIGAGSGRMTRQLVEIFESVLALDVSADQLSGARKVVGDHADRVTFEVVAGTCIPAPDGSCDGMFSCHVLQHLPDLNAVTSYLRETKRVLRAGGSICFHIPVPGAHLSSQQSGIRHTLSNLHQRIKRQLGILRIAEYHWYSASSIFDTLRTLGFRAPELRIFPMTSNGDYHSYFFAQA